MAWSDDAAARRAEVETMSERARSTRVEAAQQRERAAEVLAADQRMRQRIRRFAKAP